MESDLSISVAKFQPSNFSQAAIEFAKRAEKGAEKSTPWYEIGAAEYRALAAAGKTAFPPPKVLEQGRDISLPSRDHGREIPCRVMYPTVPPQSASHARKSIGVIMHLHGGGWVFMDHKGSDPLLQAYADATGCAVVSVGYRLAPECPYPAAVEDAIDSATALCDRAEEEFGGPVKFFIGDSTGAHLCLPTTFHLLDERPAFSLSGGLVLNYGWFDLSILPSSIANPKAPILTLRSMEAYLEAFTPGLTAAERKAPRVSPLYANLQALGARLPAALLTCGTLDPLVDNTILLGARWSMAGAESMVKFYAGACHGFLSHPTQEAQDCLRDVASWMKQRVAHVM